MGCFVWSMPTYVPSSFCWTLPPSDVLTGFVAFRLKRLKLNPNLFPLSRNLTENRTSVGDHSSAERRTEAGHAITCRLALCRNNGASCSRCTISTAVLAASAVYQYWDRKPWVNMRFRRNSQTDPRWCLCYVLQIHNHIN